MKEKKYLTEQEVAKITSIPVKSLRNLRYLKKGFSFIKINRRVRYDLDDVMGFMEKHKTFVVEGL